MDPSNRARDDRSLATRTRRQLTRQQSHTERVRSSCTNGATGSSRGPFVVVVDVEESFGLEAIR